MKRALKYVIPVAALIAQGIDEPAEAGDFFLHIDNVDGESNDANHPNDIEVLAWSWGVSNAIDVGSIGGGGGAGKVGFAPIKIIKSVDSASDQLIMSTATGQHYPEMILSADRATGGGTPQTYFKMTLETVYLSKVAHGGTESGAGLTETVTLEPAIIKIEYRTFDAKGVPDGWQKTCWDRVKNVSC